MFNSNATLLPKQLCCLSLYRMQLSVVSYRLPVVSFQLSVIGLQSLVVR